MRNHRTTLLIVVIILLIIHDASMATTGHATAAPSAISTHAAHSGTPENDVSGDCGMVRLKDSAQPTNDPQSSGDQHRVTVDSTEIITSDILVSFLTRPVPHPLTTAVRSSRCFAYRPVSLGRKRPPYFHTPG